MTMRVLIVDDEPLARVGLVARLTHHADVEVIGECGNGEEAHSFIVQQTPDLVFMDVQMPGVSGLDLLARLHPSVRPLTVLLTAYADYALRAFEVQAIDYLVKPLDEYRLAESLDRVREVLKLRRQAALHQQPPDRIAPGFPSQFSVRMGSRVIFIQVEDIDWIEAMADYAGLHVNGKRYLLRVPMHQLVQQLDPTRFLRIHRSTVVRFDRVAEMETLPNRDGLVRLHDGTPLRVSRTYTDALRDVLARR